MKSLFGKTALWVGVTIVTAAVTFAAVQQPSTAPSPEALAAGKGIFERSCGSCHSLDVVSQFHLASRNEYADIVSSMIGAGAVVSKADEPVLVDYLWATLGKKPADTAKPAASADADAAGKAILDMACTSCHGLDGMANHVYEKPDDYKSLVNSMISNGATVAPDQMQVLVDYLFKVYGKK